MTETELEKINQSRSYLIQERDAALDKITQREFPNANLVNVLRRAVEDYYRPKLDMLDFKFQYVATYKGE